MASQTKKTETNGYWSRAKRRAAATTAGEEGIGTNTKRGFAMIGAMIREAVSPSNPPSAEAIRARNTEMKGKKKEAKATKAKEKMKASEGSRRTAEEATGVSRVSNPLRAVEALTRAAKKRDK